jgi:predicted outer membrane repeat protein
MRRSTFRVRGPKTFASAVCGLAAGLAALAFAGPSHAALFVPASQAGVKMNDTDGQCSLWEAVDTLNHGFTAPNTGMHGCLNDESGASAIEVEGNGTHYKTYGAVINVYMEIYAYDGNINFAYLEHSGPSAVLTNTQGDANTTPTYVSGFTIQHTGSNPGRVITNTGNLLLDTVTIKNGDVTANSTSNGSTEAYGGGIFTTRRLDSMNNPIVDTGLVELFSVAVLSNHAKRGGGIYVNSPRGVGLTKASVTNNTATDLGGGMYTTGRLNIDTVTISDNTATGNGGGVYCASGGNSYCSLLASTVANNKGATGGGVFRPACTGSSCNHSTTVSSIISGNKNGSGGADDFNGDPHSMQLGGGNSGIKSLFSTFSGTTNHPFDFIGSAALGTLQNNFGSVTKSRSISSSSGAKDKSPASCPEYDQNFNPRPSGASCDLGAYELQQ